MSNLKIQGKADLLIVIKGEMSPSEVGFLRRAIKYGFALGTIESEHIPPPDDIGYKTVLTIGPEALKWFKPEQTSPMQRLVVHLGCQQ